MEIGYIQAPHKTLPVVFDSPRDRGLKDFPIKRVMVGTLWAWVTPSHSESLALRPLPPQPISPQVTPYP